jgi:hypothetical protein
VFLRTLPGSETGTKALVMLNFNAAEIDVVVPGEDVEEVKLVLGNYEVGAPEAATLNETGAIFHLRGYEGRIYVRA